MDIHGMNIYKRHRFPPKIIQYAVWRYWQVNLFFLEKWYFTAFYTDNPLQKW